MVPFHVDGVVADEFLVILHHIAAASNTLQQQQKGSKSKGKTNPGVVLPDPVVSAGRLRLFVARVECALQALQDAISFCSSVLSLGALQSMLRLVVWNQAAPCSRCGFGRSKQPGEVDRRTAVHWALANMIVQMRGLREEQRLRQRAIDEFTSRHRISSLLSVRVRRHIDRCRPERVRESNADPLRRYTVELMVDLLEEMRVPPLSAHPFFVNLRTKHPHLVRELCQEALQPILKSPDETVFCAGEACSRMYVVISGHVLYIATVQQQDSPGASPTVVKRTLDAGKWLSEAALWTGWVHRGELRAVNDSLLFALDASGFARVISSHKSAHSFAAAYARKFVEGLNRGLQTDLVEAGPVDQ